MDFENIISRSLFYLPLLSRAQINEMRQELGDDLIFLWRSSLLSFNVVIIIIDNNISGEWGRRGS